MGAAFEERMTLLVSKPVRMRFRNEAERENKTQFVRDDLATAETSE